MRPSSCTRYSCTLNVPRYLGCDIDVRGINQNAKGNIDAKKVTVETEVRLRQQAFRLRVGERCGWRCVVTGTDVKTVPDAAHLPGKDWRTDN